VPVVPTVLPLHVTLSFSRLLKREREREREEDRRPLISPRSASLVLRCSIPVVNGAVLIVPNREGRTAATDFCWSAI
jgi:hypothetical protein